jgi:histidyl-tRNA synthetase
LNSTGCPECKPGYIDVLKDYYATHQDAICEDCVRRMERSPLRVLDCKDARCQPLIESAPHIINHLCEECADHFATLREYLDSLGLTYTINHRLVRGLDYYTKTVFEIWETGIGAQSAVFGGGRYDGLAEAIGGPPTPGVGFGSGLERIILAMKGFGVEVPPLPAPPVFVACLGDRAKAEAVRVLNALRAGGVGAWLAFGQRGLKSQLREAGKRDARYTIILGEDELAAGTAVVRDMAAGEQADVGLAELVDWLKARV